MTFCEGFKVTDAEALAAAKLDREGVMRKITESFAYQVSRFSIVSTSRHKSYVHTFVGLLCFFTLLR